ncbi:toll/interleukin-1 receptor domain-containing protein [Desulfopila sp. IMCC35006]|uniref:toll/interleukin-1 receptor domain-containing protein n=1 Tax=Desulfopila sp. IMCC35006 TaxID=2569542 RepID=UPI001F0DF734|nr:toll/interleukin-1 receptor domain-containing protein [Desulfopila sp. IMCC35006]
MNKEETHEVVINGRRMTITANMVRHGNVDVNAKLVNNGTIEGTWQSTIGTGGNLFLINENEKNTDHENTSKVGKRNTIFISYSHEDQKHLKRLHVHIKPLEKKGLVDVWDDTKLKTGEKWRNQIESALSKAAIAILIISADFLASDFIVDNELPPILKKAELEGTLVLPVILKPCRFLREDMLSQFHALNPPDKPILSMSEVEQEEMWDKLSRTIEIELNR